MPKETIYAAHVIEGETPVRASGDMFDVSWGSDHPGVVVAGVHADRSAINRLIRVLRRARDQAYGADA